MLKKEVAVQLMKHLVEHDWHGYSQYSRWGDGEGACDISVGGKVYKVEQGDRDCSSAIISAFEAAGISCGGATYTGNMRKLMVATGNFVWHPMSSGYIAKSGDVYLNESCHTAMCLSEVPDMLMEFSISETGGIDGAEGDQTGWESHTCAYYNYPWDGILECVNAEKVDGTEDKRVNATIQLNTGKDYMRMSIEDVGNGTCKIKDKANGCYMTAADKKAGANVDFRGFDCGDCQKWKMVKKQYKAADYTMFESVAGTGLYLSVQDNGIGSNNLKLWTDLHNQKQKFYIREEADGRSLIIHAYTGKCVSAKD